MNRTKNLHRGRRRRLVLELRAGIEPDTVLDPEQLALDGLQRHALLGAIRSLPGSYQLAVTCRYFLDLSEEETARVLGWPRGSVKSRTSRALARLRARRLMARPGEARDAHTSPCAHWDAHRTGAARRRGAQASTIHRVEPAGTPLRPGARAFHCSPGEAWDAHRSR